ncbi:MAG: GspE/PulE family protein [Thermodesulfobacteriota bacterium]
MSQGAAPGRPPVAPAASPSLDDEAYLVGLLLRRRLISSEQAQLIRSRKEQGRQNLLRRRASRRGQEMAIGPEASGDLVEIIAGFGLEIPASRGEILTEEAIMRVVAEDVGLPYKKLDRLDLDLEVVTKSIPKTFALRHLLIPFAVREGVLEVAIHDPANRGLLAEIERVNQVSIRPHLGSRVEIRQMLAEFFGFQSSISAAETHLTGPGVDIANLEQYVRVSSATELASSDQHIRRAVDHLFTYALEQRASDIHVEPKRNASQVRLRIDGLLHPIYSLPRVVHPAIVSRIKTLSRLDIAEKRRPQDGRIKIDHEGREAEIRVSTVPVAFGEKVVLRILDPDILFQDLESIGFTERDLGVYRQFLAAPHGIVLVTGPTGSGKSTTLYSTLKLIATPEKNIITVEDPVEMVHEEFNQISVQPSIDVTFSTILRNILRQDPDIIMIGEIRDLETATYAIQAALTGHLVFSTLHTNDAISAITRLVDLGVQRFLLSSTLLGALAQRLVRTICPGCVETYPENAETIRALGLPAPGNGPIPVQRGHGCRQCRNTGYLGRSGVFEIFAMSEAVQKLVNAGAPDSDVRRQAAAEGTRSLRENAWQKVAAGVTTLEEAIRVTGAG